MTQAAALSPEYVLLGFLDQQPAHGLRLGYIHASRVPENDRVRLKKRSRSNVPVWSQGGTETWVLHLATVAYYDCALEERAELGMRDNLVRLAIGLEDAQGSIIDLDRALRVIE